MRLGRGGGGSKEEEGSPIIFDLYWSLQCVMSRVRSSRPGQEVLKKKKMSTAFTLQTWARPSRCSADDHVFMAVLSLIEDVKIVSSISIFMPSKLTLKNAFVTKQFYFEIASQTYRIFQLLQK